MASDRVEELEEVYSAWARGDFSNTSYISDDFEFAYSDEFPDPAVYRGRVEVLLGWREWLHDWHEVRIEAAEYLEAEPHVLVDVIVNGTGRASGAPLAEPGANLWTFRDGRPARLELFADRLEARRAAGLV